MARLQATIAWEERVHGGRHTCIVLQHERILAARHGEGLAGASLAIGKDGDVEACERGIQQLGDAARLQYVALAAVGWQHAMECKLAR